MNYLYETAPHCPGPDCFVHGMAWDYAEHHQSDCPMSETFQAAAHALEHAMRDIRDGMLPPLQALMAEWMGQMSRIERLWFRVRVWLAVRRG